MPRLSDSMEEGTILRWLKQVGDEVKRGEELVEIETDKANMTYEASDEGTLIEIVAQEGDTLPIGEVIARIGAAGEKRPSEKRPSTAKAADGSAESAGAAKAADGSAKSPGESQDGKTKGDEAHREQPGPAPARDAPREERSTATAEPRTAAPSASPAAEPSGDGRIKASPIARRMAGELGVRLNDVSGTGPGGRIVKADVEAAAGEAPARAPERERQEASASPSAPERGRVEAPTPETAKGEVEVVELNRLQRTVARRMAESKATVPHFYLQMEVSMSEAARVRRQLKEIVAEDGVAPTFNDMIVKACALALREFPRANGAYRDGRVELYSRVNVGVAVAAQDALVVPTIFDADRKSLGEIAIEARRLAGKVRDGTVTPPELSGGTFTVSNLGMYGIENFSAVINPPQAALLAVGAVKAKAVVDPETGQVVAGEMMGTTLACDHRILYGADGAQFLSRVRELLEQPLALAL